MNDKLYLYLKEEWRINNHRKYQKYFDEWVKNVTDIQIFYFKKQMIKTNSIIKT